MLIFVMLALIASACANEAPLAFTDASGQGDVAPDSIEALEAQLNGDDSAASEPDTSTEPTSRSVNPAATAAAESEAPESYNLQFVEKTFAVSDGYHVTAIVPENWKHEESFGATFSPNDSTGYGFFTDLIIGSGCQGVCEPQEWLEVVNHPEWGVFPEILDTTEVLIDRELSNPTGRIVAVHNPDSGIHPVEVSVVRWDNAADKFFTCQASFDEADKVLFLSFVEVCESAIPHWLS